MAVGLATLIVRRDDDTIYRSQLRSRAESPAHRILTGLPLLALASAAQAMAPARCVLVDTEPPSVLLSRMEHDEVSAAPLVDSRGHYLGVVTVEALQEATGEASDRDLAGLVDAAFAPIHESVHLDVVLDTLTSTPKPGPLSSTTSGGCVGTVAISDIVRNYRRMVQANLRRVSEMGGFTGIQEVVVANDSPLVDLPLHSKLIPRGVLITAIERGREVLRPTGTTTIKSGDRLMVLGGPGRVGVLGRLASSHQR